METRAEYQSKNQNQNSTLNLLEGKIPPQAVNLEVIVLGAFISQKNTLAENINLIRPEFFYKPVHEIIYTAMCNLFNRNDSVDITTVTTELQAMGKFDEIGGIDTLFGLTKQLGYAATLETHIRVITQKYILRELIHNCQKIAAQSYDDTCDLFEIISEFDEFNSQIKQHIIGTDHDLDYTKLVDMAYKDILDQSQKGFTGINTGNDNLNAITGGWAATDLILLCSRPAMGKSTRMINFVKCAAMQGKKTAIFSLEMSATQVIKKQLIEQSDVFANKILESHLEPYDIERLKGAYHVIREFKIYLNEKTSVTPNYIRQVCRERKKKFGLDMIFIDYLQLMEPNEKVKFQSEEQKIAKISTALKNIAKELNIPVMALCQLNREVEKRGDKRPIKSDLRYSGQLEQDADLILSLYRPSVYYEYDSDPDPDYKGLSEDVYERISELGILKNRHGKSEIHFNEMFYGELSRFKTAETTQF